MRFLFDSNTNTIRMVERYSKSADVDLVATRFLDEIDKFFKQYIFSNTDLKVFELNNKEEFLRLNGIRVNFINFLCQYRMIHPTMFVESDELKKQITNVFGSNAELVYAELINKAKKITEETQISIIDSDPRTKY